MRRRSLTAVQNNEDRVAGMRRVGTLSCAGGRFPTDRAADPPRVGRQVHHGVRTGEMGDGGLAAPSDRLRRDEERSTGAGSMAPLPSAESWDQLVIPTRGALSGDLAIEPKNWASP